MDLPSEVVLHILRQIKDIKTVVLFGETCHFYHSLVLDNSKYLIKRIEKPPKSMELFAGHHHVDPKGQRQGKAFVDRGDGFYSSFYYVDGKEHGRFENSSTNGISTGQYDNGRAEGIWRDDFKGYTKVSLWEDGKRKMQQLRKYGDNITICVAVSSTTCFLYDKTREIRNCGGDHPIFRKRIKVEHLITGATEKLSHCCSKHQGDLPNLLF